MGFYRVTVSCIVSGAFCRETVGGSDLVAGGFWATDRWAFHNDDNYHYGTDHWRFTGQSWRRMSRARFVEAKYP